MDSGESRAAHRRDVHPSLLQQIYPHSPQAGTPATEQRSRSLRVALGARAGARAPARHAEDTKHDYTNGGQSQPRDHCVAGPDAVVNNTRFRVERDQCYDLSTRFRSPLFVRLDDTGQGGIEQVSHNLCRISGLRCCQSRERFVRRLCSSSVANILISAALSFQQDS